MGGRRREGVAGEGVAGCVAAPPEVRVAKAATPPPASPQRPTPLTTKSPRHPTISIIASQESRCRTRMEDPAHLGRWMSTKGLVGVGRAVWGRKGTRPCSARSLKMARPRGTPAAALLSLAACVDRAVEPGGSRDGLGTPRANPGAAATTTNSRHMCGCDFRVEERSGPRYWSAVPSRTHQYTSTASRKQHELNVAAVNGVSALPHSTTSPRRTTSFGRSPWLSGGPAWRQPVPPACVPSASCGS